MLCALFVDMETTGIMVKNGSHVINKQINLNDASDIYKKDPGQLYSKAFFQKMAKVRRWQLPLAKKISGLYKIQSVVDFGCASGFYLEGFMETGVTVRGFEYLLENCIEFMSDNIKPYIDKGDLMENIDCGSFDLVMSIEVAEHLLPEKSDIFIDNLVRASRKYVLLTAAPPGQGGTGHINEQPREYWIDKLEERDFLFSPNDISKIQSLFGDLPFVNKYTRLIKRQIMFFVKD